MSRQAKWAVRARAALVNQLGGCCAVCGSTVDLEIDHIYGRDWSLRKHSSHHRVCIYRREAAKGLLQVLCSKHNSQKG